MVAYVIQHSALCFWVIHDEFKLKFKVNRHEDSQWLALHGLAIFQRCFAFWFGRLEHSRISEWVSVSASYVAWKQSEPSQCQERT